MTSQDPDRLRDLGQRLDEVQRRACGSGQAPPPNSWALPAASRPNWSRRWSWGADWDGGWTGFAAISDFTQARSS